mmetsp:Transcript_95689/g.257209  ORF Transcript_95689/g.257209 Transcript_95689/m.257209 type:complete len:247 (-) Transcript_95689:14-754(-)
MCIGDLQHAHAGQRHADAQPDGSPGATAQTLGQAAEASCSRGRGKRPSACECEKTSANIDPRNAGRQPQRCRDRDNTVQHGVAAKSVDKLLLGLLRIPQPANAHRPQTSVLEAFEDEGRARSATQVETVLQASRPPIQWQQQATSSGSMQCQTLRQPRGHPCLRLVAEEAHVTKPSSELGVASHVRVERARGAQAPRARVGDRGLDRPQPRTLHLHRRHASATYCRRQVPQSCLKQHALRTCRTIV